MKELIGTLAGRIKTFGETSLGTKVEIKSHAQSFYSAVRYDPDTGRPGKPVQVDYLHVAHAIGSTDVGLFKPIVAKEQAGISI